MYLTFKKKSILFILMFVMIFSLNACKKNNEEKTDDKKEDVNVSVKGSIKVNTKETGENDRELIRGADISSLTSLEKSGVTYYDFDGNKTDLIKLLKACGFTHIRVRIWNDPYDENGKGYGGGNCDLDNAIILGKRAADAGMKMIADFHYSDFWADPNGQKAPKSMADMDVSAKAEYIKNFTRDSLLKLKEAGALVDMVQIGNETVYGMCGETEWDNMISLMKAGIFGANEADKSIKTILHFTDIQDDGKYEWIASMLKENDVNYDIFATSYYPYWHGSYDNLTQVLKKIASEYDKDVLVVETSYPYTSQDGDGFANTVSSMAGLVFNEDEQIDAIKKVFESVEAIGAHGLGVCYWEPAWIPVPGNYNEKIELWEKYGSGWASSYSAAYDPENAGKWYGGSSWDNQAMFDSSGHPLKSLKVFGNDSLAVDEKISPIPSQTENPSSIPMQTENPSSIPTQEDTDEQEDDQGFKPYAVELLSEEQKFFYNDMKEKAAELIPFEYTAKEYGSDAMDDVFYAREALMMDDPSLWNYFWVDEVFSKDGKADIISMKSRYFCQWDDKEVNTTEEIKNGIAVFENVCDEIIDSMPDGISVYEKYHYLAEALSERVDYDLEFEHQEHVTPYCLVTGNGICVGYAEAYQYLCMKANLYCRQVLGTIDENEDENHAWNLIKIDGKTYHVDVTWADAYELGSDMWEHYFAMTQKEIEEDHHNIIDGTEATGD